MFLAINLSLLLNQNTGSESISLKACSSSLQVMIITFLFLQLFPQLWALLKSWRIMDLQSRRVRLSAFTVFVFIDYIICWLSENASHDILPILTNMIVLLGRDYNIHCWNKRRIKRKTYLKSQSKFIKCDFCLCPSVELLLFMLFFPRLRFSYPVFSFTPLDNSPIW